MLQLRPHQEDAVAALVSALADGGRAQAVMAMGTGETLVGQAAAHRLLPDGGTVAVLVPSLALISQTLQAWRQFSDLADILAVCSADDPGESGSRTEDADVPDYQGTETTTDPVRIKSTRSRPAEAPRETGT